MIKPIKNFENVYAISDIGEVFIIKNNKLLKTSTCTSGYAMAQLFIHYCPTTKKRTYKHIRVHRLVAEHFIPNPDILKFTQVNHIDGNKLNNHVNNLEWVTPAQNMQHAVATGLLVVPTALSTTQIEDALCRYLKGESLNSLIKFYKVSKNLLYWMKSFADNNGLGHVFVQMQKQNRNISAKNTGKLLSNKVIQKDLDGNVIKEWVSILDAAKSLGLGQGNISNVLAGRAKSCGGFLWERK